MYGFLNEYIELDALNYIERAFNKGGMFVITNFPMNKRTLLVSGGNFQIMGYYHYRRSHEEMPWDSIKYIPVCIDYQYHHGPNKL